MPLHDRVFRALLRILPAEFRGDYEREMTATFAAERRAARGSLGIWRLWVLTVADVFRTAPSEHLDILRRDLSYAMRMLARRPLLTLTAVMTLGLGIGVNTAIFSVVDGVLLAPLPYTNPDRLVLVQESRAERPPGTTGYASYAALRAENQTFDNLAAFASGSFILTGNDQDAERVQGARVTSNYFKTLGISPALGRDFDLTDDHPERRRVLIISDALWRRRFGADPSVVGKPVTVNQTPYELAGVMPADLAELLTATTMPGADAWTPLGYAEHLPQACRTCRHIRVVGRLAGGVTLQQAESDLTRIYQSLAGRFPSDYDRPHAAVTVLRDVILGPVKTPIYLLWGAAALLLLMACANIANLLLMRASEREEEMALRRALGVSPARMLRQLLTESVALALLGGAAGALLAWWATATLVGYGPTDLPRLDEAVVDARVLLYAIVITTLTGVLFGLAPARVLLTRAGRGGTGGENSGPLGGRLGRRATTVGWHQRATLITVNVALSVVLLMGSGLLIRSLMRLLTVDPGFEPGGVLTLQLDLTGEAYADNAGISRFYGELAARTRALPSVSHVSAVTQLPLTDTYDRAGITIEGRVLDNPASAPNADRYSVRGDYFRALGIPLLRGRVIDETDDATAQPVAVISRTMAETLWPGGDPIGRRIRVAGGEGNPMRMIVGIVGDVRHYGLHMPETMQVYTPHAQSLYPESMFALVIKTTTGDPIAVAPAVREFVRGIDPLQAVTEMRTYDDIFAQSLAARRFVLVLLAAFAFTALVLAVVGLYGALSYAVSQRQREIGVRVALGAPATSVAGLVVRQGMMPALIGLGAGVAISAVGGRLLESMLYGTSPRDAVTYVVVTGVIGGCALLACVMPARRAAAVDPAVALRAE